LSPNWRFQGIAGGAGSKLIPQFTERAVIAVQIRKIKIIPNKPPGSPPNDISNHLFSFLLSLFFFVILIINKIKPRGIDKVIQRKKIRDIIIKIRITKVATILIQITSYRIFYQQNYSPLKQFRQLLLKYCRYNLTEVLIDYSKTCSLLREKVILR